MGVCFVSHCVSLWVECAIEIADDYFVCVVCLVVDCVNIVPEGGYVFTRGIYSCAVNFSFVRESDFESKNVVVIVVIYV